MWLTQDRLFSRAPALASCPCWPSPALPPRPYTSRRTAGASPERQTKHSGRGCYEFDAGHCLSHATAAAASSQRDRRMHLWRRRVAKEDSVCGDECLGGTKCEAVSYGSYSGGQCVISMLPGLLGALGCGARLLPPRILVVFYTLHYVTLH